MKNSKLTYKRVKIHWWIILFLWGFYVWTIFAYIHQWGNNPIPKIGLIIFAVMWIGASILVFAGRFTLTIDDKFLVVKFGLTSGWDIKVHVTQIKDVSVEKVNFRTFMKAFSPKGSLYSFDFTGQTIIIQTKSDNFYQIAIKKAEKIKEEIEKRMLITNNIPSIA